MICNWLVGTLGRRPVLFSLMFFEMFQRFSLFGIEAISYLFMKHELRYSLHSSLGLYHLYVAIGYLVPPIGTILGDVYSKNKVVIVVVVSSFAIVGNMLVTMASASIAGELQHVLPLVLQYVGLFSALGFVLRAIAFGGVREMIHTLGDDQFIENLDDELIEEAVTANHDYHRIVHYCVTVATIAAYVVPPMLRMHVECEGHVYCFPLAFIVPTVAHLFAYTALLSGATFLYKGGGELTLLVEFVLCIKAAWENSYAGGKHWMDNAYHIYHEEMIDDVKLTLHVLALYLPLPIFYALSEQVSSRWVYQAKNMHGLVDFDTNSYVEPDQMAALIPIFVLVILPMLEYLLYPLLVRPRWPLYKTKVRMFHGALFAVAAFAAAGYLELVNEPTQAVMPRSGESEIWFVNLLVHEKTTFRTNLTKIPEVTVNPLDLIRLKKVPTVGVEPFSFNMYWEFDYCITKFDIGDPQFFYMLAEGHAVIVMQSPYFYWPFLTKPETLPMRDLKKCQSKIGPLLDMHFGSMDKCDIQLPKIGVIHVIQRPILTRKDLEFEDWRYPDKFNLELINLDDIELSVSRFLDPNHVYLDFFHVQPGTYSVARKRPKPVRKNQTEVLDPMHVQVRRGGLYLIYYIHDTWYPLVMNITHMVEPNSVTMWYQIPQYVLMALAVYLYPVTLLEYSINQTQIRMKSVLWTCWLLSHGFGNLIAGAFSYANLFERELYYYILFASLMGLDCALFLILLCNYIPVEMEDIPDGEDDDEEAEDEREAQGDAV